MSTRDHTCERDGVTMVFNDTHGAGARTFVLIHGIGMGRIVFDGVAEELAKHGRVLAVDLPGFGDSPEPGTNMNLQQTAAVVAHVITDEVGGPVVLVGHSMGTQIGAEVALHRPELVEALVLIAPTVNRFERTTARQALRLLQDLADDGLEVWTIGVWEYAKTSPRWFINKLRFMLDHRLEEIVGDIQTPTLVLHGEQDKVAPKRWVAEVADALPNGQARDIPDFGHEAIIKSAEPVASMILEHVTGLPSNADRDAH